MSLTLSNVTVTVGHARLIQNIDLNLFPGKLTVILGANGAGKSTTLSVIAGDARPTEGKAELDGTPLSSIEPRQLAMRRAVVLQHAPMNFALQVHEVVALSRSPFSNGAERSDEVEEAALDALQLLPLAGRDYETLSGGERQRVHIARALAQLAHNADREEPGYLLMDEPTAHLDLKHQIVALEAARKFVDSGGGGLCILHDLTLAGEFSDEIVLLKDGRVFARGKAQTLLTAERIAEVYGITDQRARRLAFA